MELIENAATKGWDAMLGVGRNPGLALDRQTAFTEWQEAKKELDVKSKTLGYSAGYTGDNPTKKGTLSASPTLKEKSNLKDKPMSSLIRRWLLTL